MTTHPSPIARWLAPVVLALLVLVACGAPEGSEDPGAADTAAVDTLQGAAARTSAEAEPLPGFGPSPELPPPFETEAAVNFPKVVGWPAGRTPVAPAGFRVTLYADGLAHPRWVYQIPNGDVLVAESNTEKLEGVPPPVEAQIRASGLMGPSADRITLLRDADGDGAPEVRETFLEGLNQPFGMLLLGDRFYVANTDAVVRFPYQEGQTRIEPAGEKILDLPAGGYNNHWTRNIVASADGSKIYVSVGSQTNVDEEGLDAKEPLRAAILEANPDGSGLRIFASGLRNPNGMDWQPETDVLWTVVNERDGLGDDLVPDFLTSVREGAFYGWPYSYWGSNPDPRKAGERAELVAEAIAPDYGLGAHTASLGLAFYDANAFPERYRGGALVGQHGSWNRSTFSGYEVILVPFEGGRPAGMPEDFLTGFVSAEAEGEVYGRPVGVTVLRDGSVLVADDAGDSVWRVSAE